MSKEEARAQQFEAMRRKREEKEEEKKAKKQRDTENISRAPNNVKALFEELNKIALREQSKPVAKKDKAAHKFDLYFYTEHN
jgi:hypothetical protein